MTNNMTNETSQKLKILVADDDPQMQIAIKATLSKAGHEATIVANGQRALENLDKDTFDLIITDQCMPEMTGLELLDQLSNKNCKVPSIMITAYGTITQAVEAIQHGAADFITKPFSSEELLRIVDRVVSPETMQFRLSEKKTKQGRPIITNDPMMIRVLEVAEAVAKSDATVLIQGESGTGKELIARLLHSASPRTNQPFVAVNCAALPANLLESELFGHEKGSFTGAQTKKIGKFELAHGGTILLDEISEMDLALQAKLLRVIQEREVDRVGGKDPISIDVRVLATTNRRLDESVKRGEFREDLYYRLNVIPLTLPPLRERQEDIKLLVNHFMKQFLGDNAIEVPTDVMQALQAHSWPGNIRELQNAVERAAILSRGKAPSTNDFFIAGISHSSSLKTEIIKEVAPLPESDLVIRSGMTVEEMERKLILETLKSTNENRTQAAKLLGISIRTLRNKLNDYRGAGFYKGE
jgi:DNA-binding NtrC family response regulator